jgi:hypothetical protein
MKRARLFYSLLFLFVALTGCKEDDEDPECPCTDPSNPECSNYDPCFGNEEPNASFFTEDRLTWPEFGENLWIQDTILKGGLIRFRSPFEGDGISHKWYIGAVIIEEPSVTRNFTNVQRPATITVSHVITYPIDTLCYPQVTGIDSTSQTFTLINFFSEFLTVENTFRGVLNNETDSFDFKFRALQNFTGIPGGVNTSGVSMYLINFHNSQDSTRNDGWDVTNTRFTLTDGSIPQGMLIIDPSDLSVEMNYNFPDDDTDYTFRGRVIPE